MRYTGLILFLAILTTRAGAQALPAQNPPLQACAALKARYTVSAVQSSVSSADLDTSRIQAALDRCNPGNAVVLQSDGAKAAFESAPLRLPRGVTLFLEDRVTLYASRNSRDYDLSPHSCGRAPGSGTSGCKPFLFSYQAAYSGVVGRGTIDGQGGVPFAGTRVASAQPRTAPSWWDLARTGKKTRQAVALPDLVSTYESQGFRLSGVTLRNAAGTHASFFKTIGLTASQVKIESPLNSGASAGILLSNSPGASISYTSIQVPGEAVSIKASILGATVRVSLHDIRIVGGEGISVGDDIYGDVRDIDVKNVSIENAAIGMALNLKGTTGGTIQNVRYSNVCMQEVATVLRVAEPDGAFTAAMPAGHNIDLQNIVIAKQGYLKASGLDADSGAKCSTAFSGDVFSGNPGALPALDLTTIGRLGEKTALIVSGEQKDGSGFTSIQQAVDALPPNGGSITVQPGTYREVVTIRKPHVHLHGGDADPAKTTIVSDNSALASGGTFNSATVFVEADDVTVDHLTVVNDFQGRGQAVALAVTGDRAVFRNLRLLGAQDTLFAASKYCYGDYGPCIPARQYFSDCYIAGNVDFIFGDSLAVFDRCELHGIAGTNVMYTAQGKHYADQASAYVFNHCRLTAEATEKDPKETVIALGRPWRPHATVVYLNTQIDAPVISTGWTDWPRFGVPSLPIAFYAEFNSSGPGAHPQVRESYAHQLSAAEAEKWSSAKLLAGDDGWNPSLP